jgi:ATP-dependent 26S proteasome regulatory subunit
VVDRKEVRRIIIELFGQADGYQEVEIGEEG